MAFDDRDFRDIPVPTIPELIEARERMDAGLRRVLPKLFDHSGDVGGVVPPPLDADKAKRISSNLLDAQAAIRVAAFGIPLEGEEALHRKLNALVNQIDDIGAVLSERFER